MYVRFQLLPYTYTLFHRAHTSGTTVLRALCWNFPDVPLLATIDNQFMLDPSILITPVLAPLLRQSHGVFPGIATGTRWYDRYSLQQVQAEPGQNVTLEAPLEVVPVHLRGGTVLASQRPANTTKHTRMEGWSLIVALDANQAAMGELFLDDGVSLEPSDTKMVQVSH
jgi:alpha-glucosidase